MSINFTMKSGRLASYQLHEICVMAIDYQSTFASRSNNYKGVSEDFLKFVQRGNIFQKDIAGYNLHQLNVIYFRDEDKYQELPAAERNNIQIIRFPDFNAVSPPISAAVQAEKKDYLTGKHKLPAEYLFSDCMLDSFYNLDLFIKYTDSTFPESKKHREPTELEAVLVEKQKKLLVLHGAFAAACVLQTAYSALKDCNFDVLLVVDQIIGERKQAETDLDLFRQNTSLYNSLDECELMPHRDRYNTITKDTFLNTLANR